MKAYGSATGDWYAVRKGDKVTCCKRSPRGTRPKHRADKAIKHRARQKARGEAQD